PLAERLRAHGCDVQTFSGREQLAALIREADVVVGSPAQKFQVDGTILSTGTRLRAVNSMVIGTEIIDVDACTELGILVANGAIAENFLGVAESTVMLILALTLDLKAKERTLREGTSFRPSSTRSALLNGRTIGLIGLGRVGRAVAERLQGWNVRLLGYDPYVDGAPLAVELVQLDELLRSSDIVSIHVALNNSSRGLLGARELALMPPHAYLLNTARGNVVDEPALAEALNSGRLAGAAVDAWTQEPTPRDNPLLSVDPDKIIVTGHCIAHSARLPSLLVDAAEENVLRELRGEVPRFVVNPAVLTTWNARVAALA
ncbi:MAG: dehydrogenase, partial [Chloroflexi bacterium]|nr:dehydrogenase [Chloroflexota bacterium]